MVDEITNELCWGLSEFFFYFLCDQFLNQRRFCRCRCIEEALAAVILADNAFDCKEVAQWVINAVHIYPFTGFRIELQIELLIHIKEGFEVGHDLLFIVAVELNIPIHDQVFSFKFHVFLHVATILTLPLRWSV